MVRTPMHLLTSCIQRNQTLWWVRGGSMMRAVVKLDQQNPVYIEHFALYPFWHWGVCCLVLYRDHTLCEWRGMESETPICDCPLGSISRKRVVLITCFPLDHNEAIDQHFGELSGFNPIAHSIHHESSRSFLANSNRHRSIVHVVGTSTPSPLLIPIWECTVWQL